MADSILGHSVFDFALEKNREFLGEQLEQALQIRDSVAFEIEVLAPWGDEGWFECWVGPIKRDGRIAEFTLIAQNITARKQAEQLLLQSHEQLEHQVTERTADLEKEIDERKRRETQLQVLQDIRGEMWNMRRKEDIEKVLTALKKGLEDLGVTFTECGINHVDNTQIPPIIRS
ncbi:MAG: PAS domain S-box protein [Candidatus Latescibacterota bacterium]